MSNQQQKVNSTQTVSSFLIAYIIFASQIGESILSYAREIAKVAGYDSWVSILLTGMLITAVISLIWGIIPDQQDLIDIHQSLFGKLFGNILSTLFGIYLFFISIFVVQSYVDVIQNWLFPDLSLSWFSLFLSILILYIVLGGFRTVAGFAFFSIWITFFLTSLNIEAFRYGHFDNLLPILNTSYMNLIKAIEPMTSGFLGIELVLLYAPFIRNFRTSLKWAIGANGITTLVYLVATIGMFVYFGQNQIQLISWPALQLWKIISFSLIERFEYVGISLHFMVIIATSCLYFWGCAQCFHRLTNKSFRSISIVFAILGFISMFIINNHMIIEKLSTILTKVGMYILYVYIPILYLFKVVKKRGEKF